MPKFNSQRKGDGVWYSIQHHGLGLKLSSHFRLSEFICKDGSDTVLLHPSTLELAEALRDEFGPFTPNSAFRTPAHHAAIYKRLGQPVKWGSLHLWGMALDVAFFDARPKDVKAWAESKRVGGVGLYTNFVHVDTFGNNRRW